jgi:predicted enzyme related to lactoylglutathione lyase
MSMKAWGRWAGGMAGALLLVFGFTSPPLRFIRDDVVVRAQTAPAGSITGVGNFSHIVASLDRSVQFYRDVIGLEVTGPPRTFSGVDAMKVGNTAGAQSRFTSLPIPGSPLGVEIIEYTDIDRKAAHPRFQDPGAANLILTVRDIDAVVARVKQAGAHINTAGGVPATIQGGSRVLFVQDPDGFFVELVQPAQRPNTGAPPSSNVMASAFEIMVADTDRTMRLYKEALGFDPQVGSTFDGTKLLMDTAGTPGAQFKRSAARIPGSPITMAFLEFKDIDRKPQRTRVQDPGTAILQLLTRDVAAVTKAWKSAGGEIVTAGEEPINLGALSLVLFRDPNNIIIEVIERR